MIMLSHLSLRFLVRYEWRIRSFLGEALFLALTVLAPFLTTAVPQEPQLPSDTDVHQGSVGLPIAIQQLVIPGPELVVKPNQDRHDPLVVRIVHTYPHGTDHRYDFEVYALEPGRFDLSEYLTYADLTASEDAKIEPVWIEVESTINEGVVQPHEVEAMRIPAVGGYQMWTILAGIAWLIGLFVWVFAARKKVSTKQEEPLPPVSVADRLRPLVRAARDRTLSNAGKAELERTIIAFWCKKLRLEKANPSEVIMELKSNAEAAPLILAMENWLHAPTPNTDVDLSALLSPYENISDASLMEPADSHEHFLSSHSSDGVRS